MLILYTTHTQSCSTIREVMTAVLYCKHWSYSQGGRSVTLGRIGLYFRWTKLAKAGHSVNTSVLTSNDPKNGFKLATSWLRSKRANQYTMVIHGSIGKNLLACISTSLHCSYWLVFNHYQQSQATYSHLLHYLTIFVAHYIHKENICSVSHLHLLHKLLAFTSHTTKDRDLTLKTELDFLCR